MRHQEDTFGHSLTDLMASVAVMFLLIAAIFIVRSKKAANEQEARDRASTQKLAELSRRDQGALEARDELANLLEREKDKVKAKIVRDKTDPYLVTLIFSEQVLRFGTGQWELDADGRATLESAGPVILQSTCGANGVAAHVRDITLEGHTDNQPFNRPGCTTVRASALCQALGFEDNVRLSSSRADSVYFALRKAVAGYPELLACLNKRFVVSGRGPVEPFEPPSGSVWSDEQSPEQRRQNRRVVIKVRMHSDVHSLGPGAMP